MIELKGERNKTFIIGDFFFSKMYKMTTHKISKDIKEFNNTGNKQDLIDIYTKLNTTMAKYIYSFQVFMEHISL